MELVYWLRHCLQIGMSWTFPIVILYVLMFAANWALGFTMPRFDVENPRPALEAIRSSYGLPGLGAAIVTDEGLQLLSTTGVRKKGDKTPITDKDLWHLGSCGKAMTATMIARLIEAGAMTFEQTLGETFPEHASTMSDQVKAINLIDLLSHTSGLPANFNLRAYQNEPDVIVAREKVLVEAMAKPLLSEPGDKFLYSNWGYTLAAHMAEKATGKSWESLMKTEVFEPLSMSTAGFGGTGSPGQIDQPWPHSAWGWAMPSNGKDMDNLPVMGPAGTMHMSLEDWGKFVTEHLKGDRGKSDYLTQASFQKLHTAIKKDYALGWMSLKRSWAGGNALHHSGDNTMNYATVWAAPKKGFAVLVVSNQGSSQRAADDVASGLVKAWLAGAEEYPKRAPFSGVRWEEQQPVVKIGEEWFTLVSIDGIAAGDIVAFSRNSYEGKWRKRFEEDLVEVLAGMGDEPNDTVRLVVRPLGSSKTRTLEGVAMTEANRQAIRAPADGR